MAQRRRKGLGFLLLAGAVALAVLLAWRTLKPRPAPLAVISSQGEEESLTGADRKELERVLRQKVQPGP